MVHIFSLQSGGEQPLSGEAGTFMDDHWFGWCLCQWVNRIGAYNASLVRRIHDRPSLVSLFPTPVSQMLDRVLQRLTHKDK